MIRLRCVAVGLAIISSLASAESHFGHLLGRWEATGTKLNLQQDGYTLSHVDQLGSEQTQKGFWSVEISSSFDDRSRSSYLIILVPVDEHAPRYWNGDKITILHPSPNGALCSRDHPVVCFLKEVQFRYIA